MEYKINKYERVTFKRKRILYKWKHKKEYYRSQRVDHITLTDHLYENGHTIKGGNTWSYGESLKSAKNEEDPYITEGVYGKRRKERDNKNIILLYNYNNSFIKYCVLFK